MDEHLDGLYGLTHPVLKRLKVGDTGVIQCSKEFPEQDVLLYIEAYAFHKNKWFEGKYDKATDTVIAKRTTPPDWTDEPTEADKEEEL